VNSPLVVAIVLSIIISIGVIKEGITDYARYKNDQRTNRQKVTKLGRFGSGPVRLQDGDNRPVSTTLQDVKVGDVLLLNHGSQIPADCIVLSVTTETCEKGGEEGFITTKNLDGETNMKPKLAIKSVQDNFAGFLNGKVSLEVVSEGPSANLYAYEGQIIVTKENGEKDV
jgi:P-type E1-E2 ATPase